MRTGFLTLECVAVQVQVFSCLCLLIKSAFDEEIQCANSQ
jgi:hypothetical protein